MHHNQAVQLMLLLLICILAGAVGYFFATNPLGTRMLPQHKGCTLEALICPDGSAVGRTGPNCEFSACP